MTPCCSVVLFDSAAASNVRSPMERLPSEWDNDEVLRWLITIIQRPTVAKSDITATFPFERFRDLNGNELLQLKETDLNFLPPERAQYLLKKVRDLTPRSQGPILWQFLRDELQHPENPLDPTMEWVDRAEGIFKIRSARSAKILAEMWGARKGNNNMTYANLSKAIRTYYKQDIILAVLHVRYTYQFGPESTGWRITSDPVWHFN